MAKILLSDFLSQYIEKPFDWKSSNCCTLCIDWIKYSTGRDLIEGISKVELYRLTQKMGEVPLASQLMEEFGAVVTTTPQNGDVVLVQGPVKHNDGIEYRPVGGICTSPDKFALITVDLGLVITKVPIIKAWTFERG